MRHHREVRYMRARYKRAMRERKYLTAARIRKVIETTMALIKETGK